MAICTVFSVENGKGDDADTAAAAEDKEEKPAADKDDVKEAASSDTEGKVRTKTNSPAAESKRRYRNRRDSRSSDDGEGGRKRYLSSCNILCHI